MKRCHCFFHFCNPSVRLRKSPTLEVQRPKVQICNFITLTCQSLSPQFHNHLSEGVLLAFYPLFPSAEFFRLPLQKSSPTFLYERGPIYSEYVQRPGRACRQERLDPGAHTLPSCFCPPFHCLRVAFSKRLELQQLETPRPSIPSYTTSSSIKSWCCPQNKGEVLGKCGSPSLLAQFFYLVPIPIS